MHGCISSRLLCLLAAVAVAAGGAGAAGEDIQLVSATSMADIEARLAALETAQNEEAQCEEGVAQWIDTSCQEYCLHFGGRILGDYVGFGQSPDSMNVYGDNQDYFEFRSLRLWVEGEGYGVFDYRLEFEFEPEEGLVDDPAVAIGDAYIGIREVPLLGYVRFGHFKEPFGLERLTELTNLTFMERGLPHALIDVHGDDDLRSVGVCAYHQSKSEAFTLAYGVFLEDVRDTAKERVDDRQGVDVAVRATWNPIYSANGRGVLHLGSGYVYTDDRDNLLHLMARPEVHEGLAYVDTGTMAINEWRRANAEMALVHGPFSVQSELFYTSLEAPPGFYSQEFYGAYVYGSWFLTGENRVYDRTSGTFTRVRPNTNFWIVRTCEGVCSGCGAWELAARWSYIEMDDALPGAARAGKMNDLTLGVNWYWNAQTRVMFNWIHSFPDLERFPKDDLDGDTVACRFQVDF